ncbi:hypothetical protein AB0K09_28575, partial [Streptomyces sp. NPDC049577]|uniref:hypothetical protein n=1 Tax=Streptomyces sp. NPDC049577 TaxID=3155153 RepID=UPI00342EF8A9
DVYRIGHYAGHGAAKIGSSPRLSGIVQPPPRHNFLTLPRVRSDSPAFDVHHPEAAPQPALQPPTPDPYEEAGS